MGKRVVINCGQGVTKQEFKEECDINVIIARNKKTGELPRVYFKNPIYGDFSNIPSYENAFNMVKQADEDFMQLDARIRKRFDNDPVKFLNFVSDPNNVQEMIDLGIATEIKKKEDKPPEVPPAEVPPAGSGS